jgi:hypothetical protein
VLGFEFESDCEASIVSFSSEREVETYVRRLIADRITAKNQSLYALINKKAVDIMVCRDHPAPAIFFLEVKFHRAAHGRLGFGSAQGVGFQPEIVQKAPAYFERNMRWIIGCEEWGEKLAMVPSTMIRSFLVGKSVGFKFNNISPRLFSAVSPLSEGELVEELQSWLAT